MMIELELTEVSDKNKAALGNLEMLLASSKDTESDLLQRLDSMTKDNDDLVSKVNALQEELEKLEMNANDNIETNEMQEEMEKLKKAMHTEKMLKVQAINKLAEIVHRKDNLSRKDKKAESKASSAELRKKEKENRKRQLDLNTEKENRER
jgi:chromosome segregation ATPase